MRLDTPKRARLSADSNSRRVFLAGHHDARFRDKGEAENAISRTIQQRYLSFLTVSLLIWATLIPFNQELLANGL
jgi:hypothetical protein